MKTINKILALTLLWLISSASTCKKETENCHYTVAFHNATDKTLYVITSNRYPDTLITNGNPNPLLDPSSRRVLPQEKNTRVLWGRDCYENDMKDPNNVPYGKWMIYVFDAAVLESTPWDTVKARNMYLKRYDLTLKDLQDRNWTITYP